MNVVENEDFNLFAANKKDFSHHKPVDAAVPVRLDSESSPFILWFFRIISFVVLRVY